MIKLIMQFFLLFLFSAAFQHVCENVSELDRRAGANETDLVFLKGLLDSPAVKQLMQVRQNNIEFIQLHTTYAFLRLLISKTFCNTKISI